MMLRGRAVDDGEQAGQDRDQGRRAGEHTGPATEGLAVEPDQLLGEGGRGRIRRDAVGMHDTRAHDDEADRKESGADIADIEIGEGMGARAFHAAFMIAGHAPQGMQHRRLHRRRHVADQSDDEDQKIRADRRRIGRIKAPRHFGQHQHRRDDRHHGQKRDQPFIDHLEPVIVAEQHECGGRHDHDRRQARRRHRHMEQGDQQAGRQHRERADADEIDRRHDDREYPGRDRRDIRGSRPAANARSSRRNGSRTGRRDI